MVKITGTHSYIRVDMDGKIVRIPGEMTVGGFVANKNAINEWEEPAGEIIDEKTRDELIRQVISKTKDLHMVIVFE